MELEEITPRALRCGIGICPALFKTDRGSVLVVGRRLSEEEVQQNLAGRVGGDEWVVEVPQSLLHQPPKDEARSATP
ncbi:MAG: hypothetical protein KAY37_10980 [Phycisphaerae bacterium]|nr:hypothetical protein [Phycisphaerae bacterium]